MNKKEHSGKVHKPAANHPWKRAVPSKVHAWANDKSKVSELVIKQPTKF